MRRLVLASIGCVVAAWISACGSSSQTVTSPSSVKCAVNAAAAPATFPAAGGSGTVSVSTNRECQWSASPSGEWIRLGSSTSGQGEGSVPFSVASNTDPAERRGTIEVGDQHVSIAQAAAPCVFSVSPTSDSLGSAGGRKTIAVTASSPQCPWTARSETEWLAVVDGSQGNGNGQVTYEARATTGPSRTGRLVIAGLPVTITQGQGCATSIAPTAQNVGSSGGSGTVVVTAGPGCSWSAQSNVPWITITSGQTGNGPGTVGFIVAAWDGPTRTGTLAIEGQVFTVTQAAGCSFSIDPLSVSIAAGAGSGTVTVRSSPGCAWAANSNAPWLTITSGASGNGDGQVQFNAAANTGPARSGTLTVAGRTFTVDQAAALVCSYAITPTAFTDVPSTGGSGSFSMSAPDSCAWTAAPDVTWLTISAGAGGSGPGTISFTVAANPGPARSGKIVAQGQEFSVSQLSGCSFALSAPSASVGSGASGGSVTVTTAEGCPWTSSTADAWIHITAGASGTGTGTVTFTTDANPGPPRAGTITIGSQTFTVNQAGL